jgi:hypothetical protein
MIRSFQWDLARQVERLDWLLAQLPRYAEWGYQELHLHLEDAVEYPSLPEVARRDAYTYKQFARLVDAASRVGIKVVPIVNLLGHTQYLIKVPSLRDLNELRAPDGSPLEQGQICPLHPRTLDVAEKLLRDIGPFCTAGKVHVGLDESFHLGRHPLSKKEIEQIGLAGHFAGYVKRLHDLTRSLKLEMGMWADMLYFLPDAIPLLPSALTAYEWYYHGFKRLPKVELFNFAEVDIATPLRKRGVELYGCPMNGAFRYEPLPHFSDRLNNIRSWWRHAQKIGAKGFLVSSWEPYRLAVELTTAVDAAAAALWLEPHVTDPKEMLARGFERAFGKKGAAAAKVALACDRYPYSGYPRWEINQRWDTLSRRESVATYRQEANYFARQARAAKQAKLPVAVRASVDFRSYLATRDLLLRRGAKGDASARALFQSTLSSGLKAAQTMWRRSRDPQIEGPNEQMVRADAARCAAWQRGAPVFGDRWQLCYRVWNFAPAAQFVSVEQRLPDGTWRTLQQCHTIEFQTCAATVHGTMIREHAAPVEWDGDVKNFPRLCMLVRGVGEVKVSAISLTGGRTTYPSVGRGAATWIKIGIPPVKNTWPSINLVTSCSVFDLSFKSP